MVVSKQHKWNLHSIQTKCKLVFCASVAFLVGAFLFFLLTVLDVDQVNGNLKTVDLQGQQTKWKQLRDAALTEFAPVDPEFALQVNNPSSAEWKALQWIILEDAFTSSQMNVDWNLLQRYAIAVVWIQLNLALNSQLHECEWVGVGCGDTNVITSLTFVEIPKLDVPMPRSLAYLPNIEFLDMSNQGLKGSFPPTLYKQWSGLKVLELEGNQLTSIFAALAPNSWENLHILNLQNNVLNEQVPDTISGFKNLRMLNVKGNEKLTGPLMEYAVPSWTQIESLVLTRTALSGTIPDFVNNGSLRHLTTFIADYTMLSGSLPESLSFASNLQTLSIGGLESLWSGTLPASYDKITSMEFLSLNGMKFINGTLPVSWGSTWSQVKAISIWGTPLLSGTLPSEWGAMTQLVSFRIAENSLSGSIPSEYGRLTNLQNLALYNSKLNGTMPQEICDLRTSSELTKLFVDCNPSGPQNDKGTVECSLENCCTLCSSSGDTGNEWRN